jgi:hypothetical protein
MITCSATWEAKFTHPMAGALSPREYLSLPGAADATVWVGADATLENLGAVDWSNNTAFACSADFLHAPLLAMAKEADEDLEEIAGRLAFLEQEEEVELRGRRSPRDPDISSATWEEEREMIISISEFLALLGMLAAQIDRYASKSVRIVLYVGGNKNVIQWVKNP